VIVARGPVLALLVLARARLAQSRRFDVRGDLPANSRTALSHLADFFNAPVEQSAT